MAVRASRGTGRRGAAGSRTLAFLTRPVTLVTALYAAAAIVSTAPAVGHFGSAFIAGGGPGFGEPTAGDHLQAVYRFWLVGHQLDNGGAPWRDPYSFQPLVDPELVLSGWPFGFSFWPLDWLFGPIVAWNLLLLVTVVLAGLATFAWLRQLRLPLFAAALGGLVFAIAPYRLAQSGVGHLLGWLALLLPLALYAYERARRSDGVRSHLWGALVALAVISIPLSGQVHLALGALPLLVLYAAVRYQRRAFLWTLSGALLGTGIAVAIQQLIIEESVLGRGGRTLDQVEMFQASWSGFIDRFGLRGAEQDVYLGWLVPAVALAGLVLLWRRNRWLALLAVVAILVPVLLAVGRNFPIYDTVWRALPPLRYPRVPQRLLPITELVLAGLVALACGWLLTRLRPQWRRAACAIAILLVAGDLLVLPFRASAADPDNAAYGALAASPPGRTLELPIFEPGIHFGSIYDYYEIQSQRQRPSGYSTLASDRPYDFFWRYNRLNCGAWLSGDIQRLRRLGVRYVLFQRGAYAQSQRPGAWFAWEELQRRGYRATARGESVWLFPFRGSGEAARQVAPVAEPPSDEPVLCEAWKSWTMRQRDAPMWVHGPARLDLELEAPGSTTIYLSVDGRAPERLQIDRQMTLSLDIDEPGWHVLLFQLPELFDTKPPSGLRIARMSYRPIE